MGLTKAQARIHQDSDTSANRSNDFLGISDADIDERVNLIIRCYIICFLTSCRSKIAKAVEAEVARRLEERERSREQEDAKLREQHRSSGEAHGSSSQTLPSGILTPLLRRHQDLDEQLRQRLADLEQKLCVVPPPYNNHTADSRII